MLLLVEIESRDKFWLLFINFKLRGYVVVLLQKEIIFEVGLNKYEYMC